MNIPNMLTVFRIILVPIYLYVFFNGGDNNILYSGLIFILAGFTDVLDGYIARKYDMITKLGSVLDPFADKLMSFAVLISFTYGKIIPPWIIIILGIKELAQIIGAIIMYIFKGKQVLPANRFGKNATVAFYISILSVILKFPEGIVRILFILTIVLNIVAFINYLIIFLKMDNKPNGAH